jgi:hypothetical protein
MRDSQNIGWILRNSCNDPNYDSNIPKLTDEELLYCIRNEHRKSGLRKLLREAKKRKLYVDV